MISPFEEITDEEFTLGSKQSSPKTSMDHQWALTKMKIMTACSTKGHEIKSITIEETNPFFTYDKCTICGITGILE